MTPMFTRRETVISLAALFACAPFAASAQQPMIELKKTPTCGCCAVWGERMQSAGFTVQHQDMSSGQLMQFKLKHGIRSDFACHTARVGGYTIEGHVPAREIRRLLAERPDAVGLAVPGMPIGSPGMDFDHTAEAYDVLLVRNDGRTEVFAHYPQKN